MKALDLRANPLGGKLPPLLGWENTLENVNLAETYLKGK
jgi:hypothetical protein